MDARKRDETRTDMSSAPSEVQVGDKSPKLLSLAQQLRLGASASQNRYNLSSETQVEGPPRRSVLVCIFEGKDGAFRVLLIKRSSTASLHPGEVEFPGGDRDKDDADAVETALRLAKTDVGLDPCLVDVVTVLQPFFTRHGNVVVPVVGILYNREAFSPVWDAKEVEAILDVPLEMFLKDESHRAEERQAMGESYLLHYFDYQSETKRYVIWALIAGILMRVASAVYGRPSEFEVRMPSFWDRHANGDLQKM